ncbi:MAG: hypothetical protein WCJ81_03955 [bacterium]
MPSIGQGLSTLPILWLLDTRFAFPIASKRQNKIIALNLGVQFWSILTEPFLGINPTAYPTTVSLLDCRGVMFESVGIDVMYGDKTVFHKAPSQSLDLLMAHNADPVAIAHT